MLEHKEFYILHMPRCGGSFIEGSVQGIKRHTPGHEGLAHFNPRGKPVYGLIRDPQSWYRSFFFYAKKNKLIWNRYFGIGRDDTPDSGIAKLVTGSHSSAEPIKTTETIEINPGEEMRRLGIGFWSWWSLHLYSRTRDKSFSIGDLSRFFWVSNRGRDMGYLRDRHGASIVPNINYVNASNRPNVDLSNQTIIEIRNRDSKVMRLLTGLNASVLNR